jgi:CBS domain-containing protein
MQKTVAHLLQSKGSEVWTIEPDDTVYAALESMAEHNVGALVVVDGGSVAGIMSERDYARKVILEGLDSKHTPVRVIMTPDVTVVSRTDTVAECMSLMTDRHIRHLPVVEAGSLVGLVSVGDVVKAVMAEQEFLIRQLEQYITG